MIADGKNYGFAGIINLVKPVLYSSGALPLSEYFFNIVSIYQFGLLIGSRFLFLIVSYLAFSLFKKLI